MDDSRRVHNPGFTLEPECNLASRGAAGMISNQSLKLKLSFQSKAVLSLSPPPLEEPEGWQEGGGLCVCARELVAHSSVQF